MTKQETKFPCLSERLACIRKERGLSQETLAKNIDISQASIGLYESGKRIPSINILCKYAEYFHTTTDYLLGRTENRNVLPEGKVAIDLKKLADYNTVLYDEKRLTKENVEKLQTIIESIMAFSAAEKAP